VTSIIPSATNNSPILKPFVKAVIEKPFLPNDETCRTGFTIVICLVFSSLSEVCALSYLFPVQHLAKNFGERSPTSDNATQEE
jgi:hypothetical protein